MDEATAALERDLESVRSAWLGSLPAFGSVDSSPDSAVECMSSSGLMAVNDALAQTRRDLDALHIRIAGAIAHRSAPELGRDGMAKQQGYRNAAALIAAATGGSGAEAARLICVGVATAERSSFSGQRMAPRHPHVAEAMKGGCLSLDSAGVITEMLDRVAPRADHEESMITERTLARRAPSLSLEQVRRLVKHAEAKLDTDGVPEREDALATASWLRIRQEASGSVLFSARLDPVNGACLKTAVETLVTAEIRRARDAGTGGGSSSSRSIPALQADALSVIARHSLSCRETVAPLDLATIIVRCTLDDVRSGSGAAMIDGIDQPISIGTVRRLAAQSGIIPMVLGGESEILDLARTQRLFSVAQRIALGERDGGCSFCGMSAAYAEAHHIRWWERDAGPTDLDNGVLLCRTDHERMHHDGWEVQVHRGQVSFIPPPHVDPARTPRPGGRARFDHAAGERS